MLPTPTSVQFTDGVLPAPLLTLTVDLQLLPDAALASALAGMPLSPDAGVTVVSDATLPAEGYAIRCRPDGCRVRAGDTAGAVYALQALSRLRTEEGLPCMDVLDAPRYAWRGMHMDVCRHFFPLSTVRKMIDLAAAYRMNKLHFHLSDDQGFRFESRKFPLLNTVGAYRRSSVVRDGHGERQDNVPHGGYYTQQELKELVAYAHARAVEIVPEFDIPGHTNAILAAYPELSCTGAPGQVVTEVGIKAFSARILCAGNDGVLPFLYALLDEVMDVFPSTYLHIGGDEAVKTQWKACPRCQQRMRTLGLHGERELQGWLLSQVAAYLKQHGRRAVVWNDALCDAFPSDVLVQHWTPATVASMRRTRAHIARGGQVVMSPFLKYYLDYPYAMTPFSKTRRYVPARDVPEPHALLGVECCLWTEWIASEDKLFFQLLPRLAAVAQTAWNGACGRGIYAALPGEYRMYERLGLPYHRNAHRRPGLFRRLWGTLLFAWRDTDREVRGNAAAPHGEVTP